MDILQLEKKMKTFYLKKIRERNKNIKASIFTYSIGLNADQILAKKISCDNNGVSELVEGNFNNFCINIINL